MSYRFSRIKPRFRIRKKANPDADDALQKLRDFLDEVEPGLVYILVTLWHSQERAITYKMLREAILAGTVTQDMIDQWFQDYTRFVVETLHPAWIEAMEAAAREIALQYPEWYFDPYTEAIRRWTEERSASFVTEVTTTQIEAIRAVVQRAAVLNDMSVDQLARAIRPMVGLTHPQAVANLNYYEKLIENGVSEEKALDLSARYGAKQHRYRGYNIARTEMAFAYNQGSYEGTKQAQEKGYMGQTVKIWCTADDERVCKICGALEGKQVGMDEDFSFYTKLATPANPTIKKVPPAHPSCRCAVMYKEVAPPPPQP